MSLLNKSIGNFCISAWQPEKGFVWVQTRDPKNNRRLSQRKDCRLVATGVCGGYLRIYEFKGKTLAWAQRLIKRYIALVMPTGRGFSKPSMGKAERKAKSGMPLRSNATGEIRKRL